jgi:hypothetical protein
MARIEARLDGVDGRRGGGSAAKALAASDEKWLRGVLPRLYEVTDGAPFTVHDLRKRTVHAPDLHIAFELLGSSKKLGRLLSAAAAVFVGEINVVRVGRHGRHGIVWRLSAPRKVARKSQVLRWSGGKTKMAT